MINLRTKSTRYRPSNGTEGDCFMSKWCSQCAMHDFEDMEKEPCDILGRSLAFSIDDDAYPDEWTYNDNGEPICTAFKYEIDEENYRCEETIDMFEGSK